MQLPAAAGCVARLLAAGWLSAAAVALLPSSAAFSRRGKTLPPIPGDGGGGGGGGGGDGGGRDRLAGLAVLRRWLAARTVPHAWFEHFYVVGVAASAVCCAHAVRQRALLLPQALLLVHCARRWAEERRTNAAAGRRPARMHVLGYLAGAGYYVAAPLTLAVAAVDASGGGTGPSVLRQAAGAALFAYGSWQQARAHATLRALRAARPGGGYAVPAGGWFERVACPHYAAEVRAKEPSHTHARSLGNERAASHGALRGDRAMGEGPCGAEEAQG